MYGDIFHNRYKFVNGIAKADTALSNANYPLSGSYVDVSGAIRAIVLIHLGTLADTVTFTMGSADSTTGTVDGLATAQAHTTATDDDGEWVTFVIDPSVLAADHHFLTCTVSGVSGTDYADIVYLLDYGALPVTQTTAVLPSDSQHAFVA